MNGPGGRREPGRLRLGGYDRPDDRGAVGVLLRVVGRRDPRRGRPVAAEGRQDVKLGIGRRAQLAHALDEREAAAIS